MPKRLRDQSEFYHQLGSCLGAGISLPQAIAHLHHHPPAPALRRLAEELGENLERGATFAEAARQVAKPLSEFDLALIEAGERSGRLEECLTLLAQVYREQAALLGQVLSQLTYPVLILHAAVFITPLPTLILSGNLTRYLTQTLGLLLPGYALVLLVVLATNSRRGEEWRAVMERIGGAIPVLGSARRDLALSRLAMALGALLNAGVSIVTAWNLAASACGSPALRRAVNGWRAELDRGMTTPGELVNRSPEFPQLFATSLLTGEASGKLDDTMARLSRYYAEEGSRKMSLVATMAPRLFYLAVLLLIARQILQTYSGYQDQLKSVLGP